MIVLPYGFYATLRMRHVAEPRMKTRRSAMEILPRNHVQEAVNHLSYASTSPLSERPDLFGPTRRRGAKRAGGGSKQ